MTSGGTRRSPPRKNLASTTRGRCAVRGGLEKRRLRQGGREGAVVAADGGSAPRGGRGQRREGGEGPHPHPERVRRQWENHDYNIARAEGVRAVAGGGVDGVVRLAEHRGEQVQEEASLF